MSFALCDSLCLSGLSPTFSARSPSLFSWLTELTPDTNATLDGFHLLRADRTRESGKSKGGGLAVFVNDRWCNPGHTTIKEQICNRDIELLAVSMSMKTISGYKEPDSQVRGDRQWANDLNNFFNRFYPPDPVPPAAPPIVPTAWKWPCHLSHLYSAPGHQFTDTSHISPWFFTTR